MTLEIGSEPLVLLIDGVLADIRKAKVCQQAVEDGQRRRDPEWILARSDAGRGIVLDDLESIST